MPIPSPLPAANLASDTSREIERQAHAIHAGEWMIDNERPIATLLGSCVAVCLFDPVLKMGGMNHFMLPNSRPDGANDDDLLRGDYAMEVLVNALLARGARKQRLVAKAFGGGNIVASIRVPIGQRNIQFARDWLEREDIPLLASDFGGPWSRKVLFQPADGTAWCKRVLSGLPSASHLAREESAYQQRIQQPTAAAGKRIELF